MDAGLGRERAVADIGRLTVGGAVEDVVEQRLACVSGASRSAVTRVSKRSANSDFSSSVGIIEVRLALPQRSPRPLSVPWIWRHAGAHRGERIGDRVFGVVVGVDAEMRSRHMLDDLGDDRRDFVRQRAAIGVAQHDPARAGLVGGRRNASA